MLIIQVFKVFYYFSFKGCIKCWHIINIRRVMGVVSALYSKLKHYVDVICNVMYCLWSC